MKRTRYLVAYDIRDPRRLRKIHKVVRGFGDSMQYSVFICDLTVAERLRLIQELRAIIDGKLDRIALVAIGDPEAEKSFLFVGAAARLPDLGPQVF